MKRTWLALVLACLAPLVLAGSCNTMDNNRNGANMLGTVKLGPFPPQSSWVGGYNLYLGEGQDGPFQKINDDPVQGGTSLMVPYLKPGKVYYFRMTAVMKSDPKREGRPGAVFERTAQQSWN